VRGHVKDKLSGDLLPGTNLIFEEFSIGAASDFEGRYAIFAVPIGKHILTVSYLGYNSREIEVTIVENRTLELDIELEPLAIEGEEVLITAQASAQQQAINQQLTSKTIKNIVSNKQIQQLPEQNAAEAVGRLPGVSLERSGGEGNKVVIRGMAPKYSQIQIDGVTMTATGSNDRSMDLSMISPYMLEGIELTKSVMANQEATATGGIVNFRIKKAPKKLSVNTIAQGGYNGLRNAYKDWKVSAGVSNRFFNHSFGVYGQFDYEEADRGSQQLGGVWFSQENETAPVKTNRIQLMDIYRNIRRIGGALVLDYQLSTASLKLSNFFSRKTTEETRYTNDYDIMQQIFDIGYSDTPESWLTIISNSLQIEQKWNNWELNANFSHAYSENNLPARLSSRTDWPSISGQPFPIDRNSNFNVNLDPETIPDSLVGSINDASEYMQLRGITHNEFITEERDLAADLNIAYNFNISKVIKLKLNMGGKIKHKQKEFDQTTLTMGDEYYDKLVHDTFEDQLSDRNKEYFIVSDHLYMIDFWDDKYDGSHLNDRYRFSPVFDKEKFRRIHKLVMDTYDPENRSISLIDMILPDFQQSHYYDYHGEEEYYAFYLMPEINFTSDILFIPGIRYEENRTKYTGYRGSRLGVLEEFTRTPIDTVTKTRTNNFWLPMIQLFYTPTEWLTLKAGYTHTLQRPDYNNIMPGWVIGFQGQIDNLSNFRLRPEQSRNLDLQLSFHSDKIGLFSAGVFHKKITDMIFWTGTTVITDTAFFELPSIMNRQKAAHAINNEFPAKNYGFEIEWQSNFWFLPGVLSGLVVNINYTRNYSEAEYLRSKIEVKIDPITYRATLISNDTTYTSPMISQPDHLLNLTLGYDYKGFSIRWAMRYTSGIFKSANWYKALRGYSTDFIRYDLSLKQQLPIEGLEIFFNVNNLTGEIEKDLINHMNFSSYIEDYGRTANAGVRYTFN
jgi:TonB-dependent receptor